MKRLLLIVGANGTTGSALCSLALGRDQGMILGFGRSCSPNFKTEHKLYQYHCVDFSKPESVELVSNIVRRLQFDRVDCIHAAGHFCKSETFLAQSLEDVQRTVEANYFTLLFAIKAWLQLAVETRNGHFIAYSTLALRGNAATLALHTATKAATESLIQAVSDEVLIENVTLNCLRLPTVRTPAEIKLKPHGDIENWASPEEVARRTLSIFDDACSLRFRGATLPAFHPSITHASDSLLKRNEKTEDDLIR